MKEMMRSMAQYIHVIQHLKLVLIIEMSTSVDVKSPVNKKFLDHVQRSKAVTKSFEEWVDFVKA